jgi:TUG ubiquitin-like domain
MHNTAQRLFFVRAVRRADLVVGGTGAVLLAAGRVKLPHFAMSSLIILWQGRRKSVKVGANTAMSAVLVDACKEHGIEASAAANYALQYKRNTVDLSQPFRLTGIPQNTTLDLKEAGSAGGSSTVRVGVKLPSGKAHGTSVIAVTHFVDICCFAFCVLDHS